MKFWFLIALMTGSVQAAPPATPGLLPTSIVRPLIDQDPAVAAARATRSGAHQDATLLGASPYEWTARAATQRRSVEGSQRFKEWNVGLERTLRLPAKAKIDREIGAAIRDEGEARYGEALHETARELLDLWLDWTKAEQTAALANADEQAVRSNFEAVEKRVKAGDAARIDAGLARSELSQQQRAASAARTDANVAWARLHARFPQFPRQFQEVPSAVPLASNPDTVRARILDQSDELKVSQAQFAKASAHTARTRADRIPDPTVGVFTASEVGGRERLSGVMISMPIPGALRTGRADKAVHVAEAARQELELKKRALDARISTNLAMAQGAYESWQLAESGSAGMQENNRLLERAYGLGEADLQALLAARRHATVAALSALAAKVDAAQAYYTLLVDAHLVWDMDHDQGEL